MALTIGLSSAVCSRQPLPDTPPPPQTSGTMLIEGLRGSVRIVRDRWGIPHIYAANQDDLFFAQGFVQAQDRLFQMDMWRRSVQGRLSEVLGSNFIERDAMTRRMQYRGDMGKEWASYGPDAQTIAGAFVRGVNAWVDLARARLPEEFVLAGWTPEHWTAEDLLNRTDAFLASSNASAEVFRARLVAAVGARQADQWLPPASGPHDEVPRGIDVATISYVVADALRRVGAAPVFSGFAVPLTTVRPAPDAAPASGGADGRVRDARLPPSQGASSSADFSSGSNAWAVSAARSATGGPLLAVDPHRAMAHPSLRYLVHLTAPGWNVIGAAAPWLPGVVIGHNDRIAWGMASLAADVQDLYVEEVNPANPHQVREHGEWTDTERVADPIVVKNRQKPFDFEREYTSHGVLVASDRERHRAFTVRWSGFEPGTAAELGALAIDRAQSVAELHDALGRWKLPAATVVYAGADGRIGSVRAGLVPRRSWSGELPVPGSTGAYEWKGWRVLSEEGVPGVRSARSADAVWSANDSVARANRLDEAFRAQPRFDVDGFKKLQHDTLAWNAQRLVPLLARVKSDRPDVEDARSRLLQWDRQLTVDSRAASLYVVWERQLMRKLAEAAALPSELRDEFIARAGAALVPTLTDPSGVSFGRRPTATRDQLIVASLVAAVDSARNGREGALSPWGKLHTVLFLHPLGITQVSRARFNVGPFERPGYGETVMSTGGPEFAQTVGASLRAIFDVGDWDRSVATNAPGQSGWRGSPHFADLARMWAEGEYFSLLFSERAVQANGEATLLLVPRTSR